MTTATNRRIVPSISRPSGGWLVVVLEGLLAVGAIGGGVGLVVGYVDIGSLSSDLPFHSPVFGGLALLAIVVVPALFAATEAIRGSRAAMQAHRAAGLALMGWIAVQVGFIGLESWLQPVMLVLGGVIYSLGRREPSH